jgi:phage terminase large subunit
VDFEMDLDAKFPAKLHDLLFSDARYRVAYGGRGAAKSWNFARALLLLGVKSPLRILCARETQESISESVHRLLSDQVELLKLGSFYTIEKARIVGLNGTEITFAGLKHNVANIKSYEGADICWVEEAQSVSKESWNTLIPTIRKSGSSIWVSFNPDFDDDPTYQMFVKNPPPDAYVCKVTWRDNDWFPEVLKREMEHLKRTDPDEYEHVWEGSCISLLQSAIYANELRAVEREDRICSVPYDRSRPVDCYWDLGYGDMTAIWFAQSMPFQYRLIDYIEDCAKPLQWYLQQVQVRGYLYGTDWLPWDIGMHATQLGSGRSIEELMRLADRKVRIVPKLSVADGIAAARTVFPVCWFDRERTENGVRALRHYRYGEVKQHHHPTREPLHDQSSHGADAFRYFAIGAKSPRPPAPKPVVQRRGPSEYVGVWT